MPTTLGLTSTSLFTQSVLTRDLSILAPVLVVIWQVLVKLGCTTQLSCEQVACRNRTVGDPLYISNYEIYPFMRDGHLHDLAQVTQLVDGYDALTYAQSDKRLFNQQITLKILPGDTANGWYNPALVERFVRFHGMASI